MNGNRYNYIYPKVNITLFIILLVLQIVLLLTIKDASLFLLLGMPIVLLSVVLSIVNVVFCSIKISQLRINKNKVPKPYILLFILAVLVPSIIWTIELEYLIPPARSDTNSISEFKEMARNCRINSVQSYQNSMYRQSPDADAYIEVYGNDRDYLYYSVSQKDELKSIFFEYKDMCSSSRGGSTMIWDADNIQEISNTM